MTPVFINMAKNGFTHMTTYTEKINWTINKKNCHAHGLIWQAYVGHIYIREKLALVML